MHDEPEDMATTELPRSNLRVAVLVSGQTRTLARTWPQWYGVIVKPYNADVYCYCTEPERAEEVRGILRPKTMTAEPDRTHPEYDWQKKLGPGNHSAQALLRQWYCLMRVYGLVAGVYDWYIRLRTDLLHVYGPEPLDKLTPDAVYIPWFCNWGVTQFGGYNDRFAVVPARYAEPYFHRFEVVSEFVRQTGMLHAETLLKWSMQTQGVPIARTNVVFNTLRDNGYMDPPHCITQYGDVAPLPTGEIP